MSGFDTWLPAEGSVPARLENPWAGSTVAPPRPPSDVAARSGAVVIVDGVEPFPWVPAGPPSLDPGRPLPGPGDVPGRPSPVPCTTLELPPFQNLAWYTQNSFRRRYGALEWPPNPCAPPCRGQRACVTPLPAQVEAAAEAFPLEPLRAADLSGLSSAPGLQRAWSVRREWEQALLPLATSEGLVPTYAREVGYVSAALAFITDNVDLVDWSVCLAAEYGARDVPATVTRERMYAMVRGDTRIYLVGRFWTRCPGGEPDVQPILLREDATLPALPVPCSSIFGERFVPWGATGAATDILYNADIPSGVILPILHPYWVRSRQLYESGSDVQRVGALLGMAQVLVHEWMHLAAANPSPGVPPTPSQTDADDADNRWATQNMAAMALGWALGQRYPCLQNQRCLPKLSDTYFLSSEPTLQVFAGGALRADLVGDPLQTAALPPPTDTYEEPLPWDPYQTC